LNDPRSRRRILWLAGLAGALLLALVLVPMLMPSASPGNGPTVRPGESVAAPAQAPKSSSSGFSLGAGQAVSLAWRLALAATIIGVSIAGLRWWGRKTSGPRSVTGFIRVVDTLSISNGRSLHLVAMGDRVIAIGATAQTLTLLNELTPDESETVLARAPAEGQASLAGFATELFHAMRREPHVRRDSRLPAMHLPREDA
jgi:flagellar biogenesis protein FliO